eukprot:CAMPEP_0201522468 /NCGR_PEP_ID=MMETSP0161_2-20130828/17578_1 /ASSEMBLY_ACC=CAM_ASM_000251 /TAXON_ID=180227 /ORGANISM="Neoparamoeba aestuarina, Strain SoJaBio B1-5/56/2" /LENGTH=246 /DNA_ID=CAMNT_0047921317 /DNA_START=25 /DNA_END=765 /DNA_ORIENTATION=+
MELECKLIIDSGDIDTLIEALGTPISIENQENHFLDSPDEVLHANHCTLRIRVNPGASMAQCTLKEDSETMHGTCVRWSTHAEIPMKLAERVLREPEDLMSLSSNKVMNNTATASPDADADLLLTSPRGRENPITSTLRSKYGIETLKYAGGFKTVRRNFLHPGSEMQPQGLVLKLDAVELPASQNYYELEVVGVTVPLSDVLNELCSFLEKVGVKYKPSEGSKYEVFVREKQSSLMNGDIRSPNA